MPSLTSNPDNALFERFKAMERRLHALETLRRPKRSHLLAYNTTGTTYTAGVYTNVVLSDTDFDTHGMLDTSTGIWTVPFTGRYLVHFITPVVTIDADTTRTLFYRIAQPGGAADWTQPFTLGAWDTQSAIRSFEWTAGDQRVLQVQPVINAAGTHVAATLLIEQAPA